MIGKIPALPRLRGARAGPPITGALLQQVLGPWGMLLSKKRPRKHSELPEALRAKMMVYNSGIVGGVDWLNFVRGSFLSGPLPALRRGPVRVRNFSNRARARARPYARMRVCRPRNMARLSSSKSCYRRAPSSLGGTAIGQSCPKSSFRPRLDE